MTALLVDGAPSGSPAWRARVAAAATALRAAALPQPSGGVSLDVVLRPRQFVDLDTLTETALAGLRDAGLYARGLRGLDVVLATAVRAGAPGARIAFVDPDGLAGRPAPGPTAVTVDGRRAPRAVREQKVAWREAIATAWGRRAVLEGPVWADVSFATDGSLLARLEPTLDALEPVLGRDGRGREWQEFFPADDRIVWLRVRRSAGGPAVRLRIGPVPG